MQLTLAITLIGWRRSPCAPQPETGWCRCACASRPRRFDSCIPCRAPSPCRHPGRVILKQPFPPHPGSPAEVKCNRSSWRGAGPGRALAAGRSAGLAGGRAGPAPSRAPLHLLPPPAPRPAASGEQGRLLRLAGRPSSGRARAPVIGGWFAAHMFLCLAGPRALFAQQHVVPLEESEPTLKVQGTAKLCWEAAGPGPGGGMEREAGRAPSQSGPGRALGAGDLGQGCSGWRGPRISAEKPRRVGGFSAVAGQPCLGWDVDFD